jgi:lipase maturation factor 1
VNRPSALLDYLARPLPDLQLVSSLFLRLLGLAYLAAFASAAMNINGLVGADGILPATGYLDRLWAQFGPLGLLRFPTLFWIDASDAALLGASYAGCLVALLLILGWRPLFCTVTLFLLYLSLSRVGQIFFNFQWDYLLLETGLLAIFVNFGPGRLLVFLFHWLLFRLRFLSGLSKLLSDDPSWANLAALNHYFETQPLPHIGAWYAHQLPTPVLQAGTGMTLAMELIVPFFIFLPRPFRITAAVLTIALQVAIVLTSNHNFINLLTIALCLFLLDDRALRSLRWRRPTPPATAVQRPTSMARPGIALLILAVPLLGASAAGVYQFVTGTHGSAAWDAPVSWVRGWGQANVYHVFPTMQTERQELVIQGSNDGIGWETYRFRFKPDSPADGLRFSLPLHPHLDWMMWFVPTQQPAMRFWFERLMWQLQAGSPSVLSLLESNPFPQAPPRYLRVLAYDYRFTTPEERATTGHAWTARLLGVFPQVAPRHP